MVPTTFSVVGSSRPALAETVLTMSWTFMAFPFRRSYRCGGLGNFAP
jgi:hypothetical protein